MMKYDWDSDKNEWLKKERKVSFERIVFHLHEGDLWKIFDHPDPKKYPGQKIYFIVIEEYVYLVPFQKARESIFLKTIIPNRKATREYRKERGLS